MKRTTNATIESQDKDSTLRNKKTINDIKDMNIGRHGTN